MCNFIEERRDEHGVEPICLNLQIVPSTYYARRSRQPSDRAARNAELTERCRRRTTRSTGPGRSTPSCAGRILRRPGGADDARRRTARGLPGQGPRTTKLAPETGQPSDLVNHQFTAEAPDQFWVADIDDTFAATASRTAGRAQHQSCTPLVNAGLSLAQMST